MVKNPIWLLLIFLGFSSCQDRPVFPVTPSISLNEFYFQTIDDGGQNLSDSIVISINFEDGDADLGLEGDDIQTPYQLYDVVLNNNGDTVRFGDDPNLPPYNCFDYEIISKELSLGDSLVRTADTIAVLRNLDHYNFFLTFLIKEGDNFVEYNTYQRLCAAPFHGRFFNLNTAGDARPLEGEIIYGFISSFRLLFGNYTTKLRIQIQDKARNKSNIIETEEFNVREIARPPK